jgi:hypothetical protein
MQNPFIFIKTIIDKIRSIFNPPKTPEPVIAPAPKKSTIPDKISQQQNAYLKQAALENFISTTPDKTYEAVLSAGSQLIEAMHPKK